MTSWSWEVRSTTVLQSLCVFFKISFKGISFKVKSGMPKTWNEIPGTCRAKTPSSPTLTSWCLPSQPRRRRHSRWQTGCCRHGALVWSLTDWPDEWNFCSLQCRCTCPGGKMKSMLWRPPTHEWDRLFSSKTKKRFFHYLALVIIIVIISIDFIAAEYWFLARKDHWFDRKPILHIILHKLVK